MCVGGGLEKSLPGKADSLVVVHDILICTSLNDWFNIFARAFETCQTVSRIWNGFLPFKEITWIEWEFAGYVGQSQLALILGLAL